MPSRAGDWLRQAERDQKQAEDSRRAGRHEWACFAAHQAAEKAVKAVKALHLSLAQEAWGHVVARLLVELPESAAAPAELVEKAKTLDGFYIPARCPNGYPEGAPFEHYGPLQSAEGIRYARGTLEFTRSQMA